MPYVALYRKLRPTGFSGIVGQEHIVRTLVNQLKSGRISHAYLFCGTRGTGKTSTAKIYAKALNCYKPDGAEPCNVCESCEAINSQRSMNVIEIDAASNNGVDNIRDIREEIKYPPATGKYKVYIIDEVHMLSTGAFNALLKTLEEPPEHVIFILATTEPQKIPATIHSRCQRYDFKRISSAVITETLTRYMKNEHIDADEDAIRYAAHVSGGALRDAISIMDQCAAFYFGEKITLPKVLELLGAVDIRVLFELTDAIYNHDSRRLLEMIEELAANGRDMKQLADDLTVHFRDLLVAAATDTGAALDYPRETIERLRAQSKYIDKETLIYYINEFSALQNKLRYATNDRLLLEVLCIKLCNPYVESSNENINSRIKKLEEIFDRGLPVFTQSTPQNPSPEASAIYIKSTKPSETAQQQKKKTDVSDIKPIQAKWKEFTAGFENPLKVFLALSEPVRIQGETLYVACDNENNVKYLQDKNAAIESVLNEKFDNELKIRFIQKENN